MKLHMTYFPPFSFQFLALGFKYAFIHRVCKRTQTLVTISTPCFNTNISALCHTGVCFASFP
jgi:hypothetical protein